MYRIWNISIFKLSIKFKFTTNKKWKCQALIFTKKKIFKSENINQLKYTCREKARRICLNYHIHQNWQEVVSSWYQPVSGQWQQVHDCAGNSGHTVNLVARKLERWQTFQLSLSMNFNKHNNKEYGQQKYPFMRQVSWLKSLHDISFEPTYQNSIRVPKVYKTLRTSVICTLAANKLISRFTQELKTGFRRVKKR